MQTRKDSISKFLTILVCNAILISCAHTGIQQGTAPQYVYHASPTQNIKVINSHVSTHQKKWIYAKADPDRTVPFLGHWGDYDLALGSCDRSSGVEFIVERYKGAFDKAFKGHSGSIYQLSGKGFSINPQNATELVYAEAAKVEEEYQISDTAAHLRSLQQKGKYKIYYFPSRPSCVPADDSDIIDKAVRWINIGTFGDQKTIFLKRHPHLRDRLEEALEKARKK